MIPSLPLLSCESSVSVKENPGRKKFFFSIKTNFSWFFSFFSLYPVTILLRFIGAKSYTSSFYQLSELRQIAC